MYALIVTIQPPDPLDSDLQSEDPASEVMLSLNLPETDQGKHSIPIRRRI